MCDCKHCRSTQDGPDMSEIPAKPESEPLDDPFGWRAHDKQVPEHSGLSGHYCMDFDGLWICRDCSEWDCCTCYGEFKDKCEVCGGPCVDFAICTTCAASKLSEVTKHMSMEDAIKNSEPILKVLNMAKLRRYMNGGQKDE